MRPNSRSTWSRRAKGVLDPDNAMRAVGHALNGQHIEAHYMAAPLCLPLQEELSGANDLALLAPCDRGKRPAEIVLRTLPHLDDRQHTAVEADQIEFPGFAPHIACEHDQTSRVQIFHRQLLGRSTPLQAGISGHIRDIARAGCRHHRRYVAGSWQYGAMPAKRWSTRRSENDSVASRRVGQEARSGKTQ